MHVEIGKVYEGTVKNIANYGMFVRFMDDDGEPVTGMVHISEISHKYVTEIRDVASEGDKVRVKCIGINPQGKISLSMKQLEEEPKDEKRNYKKQGDRDDKQNKNNNRRRNNEKTYTYEPKKKPDPENMTFEDMLSQYKQTSEERICDIKRSTERKNRSRRK